MSCSSRAIERQELARGDESPRSASHDEHVARTRSHRGSAERSSGFMESAPTGQGAMHFRHPVQVGSSISRPSRKRWIASGGQSGRQRPQRSQRAPSTTAISVVRDGRERGERGMRANFGVMLGSVKTMPCPYPPTLLDYHATVLLPPRRIHRPPRDVSPLK
jgi:hypothetical protein